MLLVFTKRNHPQVEVPVPTIRQPRGGRGWLVVLSLLLVVAAIGALVWKAYRHGIEQEAEKVVASQFAASGLESEVQALTRERDDLLQRVAAAERGSMVDREAAEQVRQSLVELQDERLELREEVALLTSLISSGKSKSGLRARRLVIEPLAEPGGFRYRFALSKSPQDDEEVKASVSLVVVGEQDGETKELSFEHKGEDEPKDEVKFKQFLQVEGVLSLPKGFKPNLIKVVAKPKKQEVLGVEREFPWNTNP